MADWKCSVANRLSLWSTATLALDLRSVLQTSHSREAILWPCGAARRSFLVCLLLGLFACLLSGSQPLDNLSPTSSSGTTTATLSSRNRSWGFPSSLRPGSDGEDPEPVSSLPPPLPRPDLLPTKNKLPGTTAGTAAGTGNREHPDPTNAMAQRGQGAGIRSRVRRRLRDSN